MQHRRPHVLSPTVGNARPGEIIFFDTETNQTKQRDGSTKHTLKLGYAEHWRYTKRRGYFECDHIDFTDLETFWSWVDKQVRKKSTCYLVAHNIVFDLAIVHAFRDLAGRGWKLMSFYSKSTTSIFRWKDGERRLIGVDNMNLFQGKLSKWGDLFKFPKGHVDFDTVSDVDLLTYCIRDVQIMVRSWLEWMKFLDSHDLGNFKVTIGSTALSAWRYRFMKHKVFIHTNDDAMVLERDAYHGGRTECFWTGTRSDGPFYYLDVNNMYGYVLSKFDYPAGIWSFTDRPDPGRLLRKLEKQAVIARVQVETTEPVFPIPFDGYTVYPVGQFKTTLTSPELILAIERGWFREVYAMAWYRRAPLFADYIEYFHGLRTEYKRAGNDGYAQIAKMLNNSLYGKFGQSGFDQKRIGDCPIDDTWSRVCVDARTHAVYRMFALGGGVYEERKTGESANSFPAIAAHVTAYARLYLWSLITTAGRDHVYYSDTDSIIVDQQGLDRVGRLLDPSRLGYLKVEHKSTSLSIFAPKDYSMDDRVRIKGVMKDGQMIAANLVEQDQWERLGRQFQRGNTDDFIVNRVRKALKRVVRSGTVLQSGWVVPFVLGSPDAQGQPIQLIQPVASVQRR